MVLLELGLIQPSQVELSQFRAPFFAFDTRSVRHLRENPRLMDLAFLSEFFDAVSTLFDALDFFSGSAEAAGSSEAAA